MNVILLSGGSGKRLWPLSNDIRSKQFLKIFKKADGSYESMLQRVYRQLKALGPNVSITIASSKTQISSIKNQLADNVDISAEPARRDTFPAIALATAYLTDIKKISPEETAVVCPVDPLVDEWFFKALKRLGEIAADTSANLVLMGIKPTYPSEKYGYIIPETANNISRVLSFQEKPKTEEAKAFIKQGALWNGGVFAYKLKYVLGRAKELMGFCGYDELFSNYKTLKKISFDYAVSETEPKIEVLRFNGLWKDLGTWNTLTEAMSSNTVGDVVLNDSCKRVHAINELGIPLLCMGLKNAVVVAGVEGILVSDKGQSSYIKPYVEKFVGQVRFAEKSWGTYQIINIEDNSITVKVVLKAGCRMNYHSHSLRNEVWNIISGEGLVVVDGMKQPVSSGDVITLQAGCRHTVIAKTELKIIEVQIGKEIRIEDKQKFELEGF